MPVVKPRRWVVLIQRRPRGPMGEAEVQALLTQGLVRTNDLAFEVSPENGKALTDWKMLWQFPEFDRRAKDHAAKAARSDDNEVTLWSTPEERRAQSSPQVIQQRVKEALPEELLNITPEDLIPRQGMGGPGSRLPQVEEEDVPVARPENTEGSKGLRWAGIGLGALVGISLIAQWISAPRKNMISTEEVDRTISSPEDTASAAPRAMPRTLPGGDRPRNVGSAPTPIPVPVAREEEPSRRDGGNIPFEASRDNDDEMAEEDDAVAEDFTFESSRKSAKKKKKKLAPVEEDSGDAEENSDSREPAENEEVD